VAPLGQLSADGQLRELIEERRQRQGADGALWHLGPEERTEAIVAGDAAVITCLQVRFGRCAGTLALELTWLRQRAMGSPAQAGAGQ